MTIAEALQLIRSSTPWQLAEGDPAKAWARWSGSNRAEAAALLRYMADQILLGAAAARPALATKYGRGMAELVSRRMVALLPPLAVIEPPPPPPPPPAAAINGAAIDTAGNAVVSLLLQCGIKWVCVELLGDAQTPRAANVEDFKPANRQPGGRWHGFERYGLFYVSRKAPTTEEIKAIVKSYKDNQCTFLVVDTEAHKVGYATPLAPNGGDRAWTEDLYANLRPQLPLVPIFDVAFGIHQDKAVVNHDAKAHYCTGSIFETYDGNGVTLGVVETLDKVNGQGYVPADIMLGTKSLTVEITTAKVARGTGHARDVWLWAPDHGPAIEALATGLKLT